jgi:16S rRNA processing protein RimM
LDSETPKLVLLARIGAAHGVRGEVRVKSFTADPMALGGYGPLSSRDGRVFLVERLRPAKEVVVAKFRGVDDRNAAEALNGTDLFVPRDRLPAAEDEDEFYHADLIGLSAEAEDGTPLGTVVAIHNFGAGDILDIAPPRGPSLLVPFTKAVVPDVDLVAGRLVVIPPPEIEVHEEEA